LVGWVGSWVRNSRNTKLKNLYEHVYSPKIGRKTIKKKKRGQTDMYRDKSIKT